MTYTARLKVFCDDKVLLSQLNYIIKISSLKNRVMINSKPITYGGKLDKNHCTKVYNCNQTDLITVDLMLNNSVLKTVPVLALQNGTFSKSSYTLKTATGATNQAELNRVPVNVKNELEIALENLHGTAIYFGNNFLAHDGPLRQAYIKQIKQMSNQYLIDVKQGKISLKKAAEEANQLRNSILEATRRKNSPIALAVSQKEKMAAKTLAQFLEYYAFQLKDPKEFERLKKQSRQAIDNHVKSMTGTDKSYFRSLSHADRNKVYYSVIKGSGRSNGWFDKAAKVMKPMGRVIVFISIAYAGYEIYNAENREKEVYKQGATIGGGIAGGAAGGAIAGGICGPGSPICSIVGVVVGGVVGGYGAYKLVEAFDDELEAFTKWNLF